MRAGEDDFMRALSVLVHDLRAPLSVAGGYLRLIKEERLTSIEDRDRALTGAIEAIRRMSRLCEEASDFGSAHDARDVPTVLVAAGDLAARVARILNGEGTRLELRPIGNAGYVRVTQADRVASAVANILRSSLQQLVQDNPIGLDVLADDQGLRFLVGTAPQRHALTHNEVVPFDPWRSGHGLQLATACCDLQRVAGRVWTTVNAPSAIGVRLPLEARPS